MYKQVTGSLVLTEFDLFSLIEELNKVDPNQMAKDIWTSHNYPLVPEIPFHLMEEHNNEDIED